MCTLNTRTNKSQSKYIPIYYLFLLCRIRARVNWPVGLNPRPFCLEVTVLSASFKLNNCNNKKRGKNSIHFNLNTCFWNKSVSRKQVKWVQVKCVVNSQLWWKGASRARLNGNTFKSKSTWKTFIVLDLFVHTIRDKNHCVKWLFPTFFDHLIRFKLNTSLRELIFIGCNFILSPSWLRLAYLLYSLHQKYLY